MSFTSSPLNSRIIKRISGISYRENPNISLNELAYLTIDYIDFNNIERQGELICSAVLSDEILDIFRELFLAKYPIEKICLADDYNADDDLMMADNNSSCFNYCTIANTNTVSLHGLGRAIDINPLYNPYIVGDKIMPPNGSPYVDRSVDFPHKIDKNDTCFKIFTSHGWLWGGNWKNTKDYQHFYKPPAF